MSATAIVGAAYGSEGKGAVVAYLANRFNVAVRTGGPNAGHSLVHEGKLYKMRQIPCPWINPDCELVLGAGAMLDLEVLAEELADTGIPGSRLRIDRSASVISKQDRGREASSSLTKMGSTLEGVGAARINKILRDVDSPSPLYGARPWSVDTVRLLWTRLNQGAEVLLEGTQGSGLSLHHGHWPHVTSNDTNAGQLLADAGVAPGWLKHVILVARTYPIRVGGPSGPMPGGEIDFSQIPGNVTPERTTVTKKIRRISYWDPEVVGKAIMLNDPCGIALTFTDYLDPEVRDTTNPDDLWNSPAVRDFIFKVEHETRTPVVIAGVGGETFRMLPMRECKHGEIWDGV